jgi:hypothetical protein
MKYKALIIIIVIYFPIFIRLSDNANNHYRIVTYFMLFIFALYTLNNYKTIRPQVNKFSPFITFSIVFIVINIVSLVFYKSLYANIDLLTRYLFPFFLGLLLLLFLSNFSNDYLRPLLEKTFHYIGIVFLIQFTLSIYQSYTGNPLIAAERTWLLDPEQNLQWVFEQRTVLSLINVNIGFKFPLSMLLGHHNSGASHIAIYNVIFLYMFYKSRKRFFALLSILVVIAAILNTTRALLGTILLINTIYYFVIYKKKMAMGYLLRIIIIIVGSYYIIINTAPLFGFFKSMDTFHSKISFFMVYFDYLFTNLDKTILGHGASALGDLGTKLRYTAGYSGGSFESGLFSLLFRSGIFIFFLFLTFVYLIYNRACRISYENKSWSVIIIVGIFGTFMTTNGIIDYHTYQFLTLIYIYNIIQNASIRNQTFNDRELIK